MGLPSSDYVGRFAPTPSGPLHLGSLLTAVSSFLDAKAHGGSWRLRIDDLDAPRVVPTAEASILETLDAHGLQWDGEVSRQSLHREHYAHALQTLADQGLTFKCTCTRKQLAGSQKYPGTCRSKPRRIGVAGSVRVMVGCHRYEFDDLVQGRYAETLSETIGDFIVQRRDGLASYQLAVAVDDALTGITHVVRGADLLDNTPRQLHLMSKLGIEPPTYAHVPVITEASGVKLSKHTAATAIDVRYAARNVGTVLELLGHPPPESMPVVELLAWALEHWDLARIPRAPSVVGFVSL